MASTNFSYGTLITSVWLNDVNTAVYTTLPALSSSLTTLQGTVTTLQGSIPDVSGFTAALATKQDTSAKNTSNGYVGTTNYGHDFYNTAGTFKSSLVNTATAVRSYTFPDKSITVAGTTNETFTKPTIKGYVEQLQALNPGATVTVNPDNGTLIEITTTANITITLPAASPGVCYTLIIAYGGVHTVTFAGGTSLRWAGAAIPVATSVAGKIDKYVFTCGGSYTLGQDGGRNF